MYKLIAENDILMLDVDCENGKLRASCFDEIGHWQDELIIDIPKGNWIPLYETSDGWRYECSNCGNSEIAKIWVWKFCPHCGHPMNNIVEEVNK